jgi:Asp-tRNA(Asn)/Glu-tRNA(Gln) amidotransferase A subunit family amidase
LPTPRAISGSTTVSVAVNYLRLCAVMIPVGGDRADMPVGLQLIAPAHSEEELLTVALARRRSYSACAVDYVGAVSSNDQF